MTALLPGIFLFWFGVAYELQLANYGLKTVSKDTLHARLSTFGASVYVFQVWHVSQATPRLLNRCNLRCFCASTYLLDLLNGIAPVSEVSSCDYSNHLDINSVWNSLVASCLCVANARARVFNTFVSSTEVFTSTSNAFIYSAKSVRPQHKMHSSPAINMFVCSVIHIWR